MPRNYRLTIDEDSDTEGDLFGTISRVDTLATFHQGKKDQLGDVAFNRQTVSLAREVIANWDESDDIEIRARMPKNTVRVLIWEPKSGGIGSDKAASSGHIAMIIKDDDRYYHISLYTKTKPKAYDLFGCCCHEAKFFRSYYDRFSNEDGPPPFEADQPHNIYDPIPLQYSRADDGRNQLMPDMTAITTNEYIHLGQHADYVIELIPHSEYCYNRLEKQISNAVEKLEKEKNITDEARRRHDNAEQMLNQKQQQLAELQPGTREHRVKSTEINLQKKVLNKCKKKLRKQEGKQNYVESCLRQLEKKFGEEGDSLKDKAKQEIQRMIQYYRDYVQNTPKWRLLGDFSCLCTNRYQNCTSLCNNILRAGGIYLQDSMTKLVCIQFTGFIFLAAALFITEELADRVFFGDRFSTETQGIAALVLSFITRLMILASQLFTTCCLKALSNIEEAVTPKGFKEKLLEIATDGSERAKIIHVKETLEAVCVVTNRV